MFEADRVAAGWECVCVLGSVESLSDIGRLISKFKLARSMPTELRPVGICRSSSGSLLSNCGEMNLLLEEGSVVC